MNLSASHVEHKIRSSLNPIATIQEHLQANLNGRLEIIGPSAKWFVYIERGQLVYLTHSIDPVDRLDGYLKCLSRKIPTVTAEVRTQIRLTLDLQHDTHRQPDLEGIALLKKDRTLTSEQAEYLTQQLSREALEHLLMVHACTYRFETLPTLFSQVPPIHFDELLKTSQQRIQDWQAFGPYIDSPYQRPYLFSQSQTMQKFSIEQQQHLGKLLKGFCFRHLAYLLDQDELKLIKSLYPLILDKTIRLRDPQPPYNDLPRLSQVSLQGAVEEKSLFSAEFSDLSHSLNQISQSATPAKTYRVACVDNSPAMLQTIEQFLAEESLLLFLVQDSVKALIEIMRIKPDLVLLDVGMPKVDGYELCRLLRKHASFKSTPIIMVTGNTGLIDRARAKLSGATDYMTKPFTQSDLQKIVFRHLAD